MRLRRLGIGHGDRVAIFHDNSLPGLVWFWGVQKAGACTVDVPTLAGRPTIQGVLDEAQPKAIAIDAKQIGKVLEGEDPLRMPPVWLSTDAATEAARTCEAGLHTLADILAVEKPERFDPPGDGDDVAL